MDNATTDTAFSSRICIRQCQGICCDPWWGIISYTVRKEGGLSRLHSFREELIQGVRERAKRIMNRYVTNEALTRPIFQSPERYHLAIENIQVSGNSLLINLRAMFAFRCLFLSPEKRCAIHPSVLGGNDIRPPHCGYLGSMEAKTGEKGFCRIIHAAAASSNDPAKIKEAIEMESTVSGRYFHEGYPTAEMAVDAVVEKIREYAQKQAPHLLPLPRETGKGPGRNEPCYCGSGRKYKKCHGG